MLHPVVEAVTARIAARSAERRARYLARLDEAAAREPRRHIGCSNLAHALAAQPRDAQLIMRQGGSPHIAIVSSYNDLLSAHQPLQRYPEQLKAALARVGATAQFAAGVPAMCDGITQGEAGMQLSLFSRDLIAQAAAIGLTHGIFDGGLYLGVCDKIVPGLLIGALRFGHLPAVFVPAGPMPSGLSNSEKAAVRQRYARGEVSREELLEAELRRLPRGGHLHLLRHRQHQPAADGSHGPACAGLAPSCAADSELRHAAHRGGGAPGGAQQPPGRAWARRPIGRQVRCDEVLWSTAVAALLATGGSTNHSLHLVAMARAAGFELLWEDFAELSKVVPLLARVYPNGTADVNQFQAAGGPAWIIRELLGGGLLHGDVATVVGESLRRLSAASPGWTAAGWPGASCRRRVRRRTSSARWPSPSPPEGGPVLLAGNLGRAQVKTSAVDPAHWRVRAPARVFDGRGRRCRGPTRPVS